MLNVLILLRQWKLSVCFVVHFRKRSIKNNEINKIMLLKLKHIHNETNP